MQKKYAILRKFSCLLWRIFKVTVYKKKNVPFENIQTKRFPFATAPISNRIGKTCQLFPITLKGTAAARPASYFQLRYKALLRQKY